jgi:hypothetical protein
VPVATGEIGAAPSPAGARLGQASPARHGSSRSNTSGRSNPIIHRARTALDSNGAEVGNAFESKGFSRIDIDEIAAAVGADPVAVRLRYLKAPRDIAVVKAAAERAKWQPRPSPRPDRTGDTLTGRGIAYVQGAGSVVAIVAEIEIDRRSGKVWARKFTVAHASG